MRVSLVSSVRPRAGNSRLRLNTATARGGSTDAQHYFAAHVATRTEFISFTRLMQWKDLGHDRAYLSRIHHLRQLDQMPAVGLDDKEQRADTQPGGGFLGRFVDDRDQGAAAADHAPRSRESFAADAVEHQVGIAHEILEAGLVVLDHPIG